MPPCCNTAAESRRESALVDAKDIRLPFSASHCPVSDHEIQGQGSQAEASMSPVEDTGKASALPSRQNSEKELAGLQYSNLLLLCLLMVGQTASYFLRKRHILYCASQPTIYTSGRPGCALMHF